MDPCDAIADRHDLGDDVACQETHLRWVFGHGRQCPECDAEVAIEVADGVPYHDADAGLDVWFHSGDRARCPDCRWEGWMCVRWLDDVWMRGRDGVVHETA